MSELSPCLTQRSISWIQAQLKKQGIQPQVVQMRYLNETKQIGVVRIEIDGRSWLASPVTGQLYSPHTGVCQSSSHMSIR